MRLSWDEYFMALASITAKRSKDPSTQVGAVVVDEHNRIVSLGYNGMPHGVDDKFISWNKNADLDNKYLYVCHAELNAILNVHGSKSVENCTIYVTLFPCNECAKVLVQTGITRVVYLSDKYHDQLSFRASRKILEAANIEIVEYSGKRYDIIEL